MSLLEIKNKLYRKDQEKIDLTSERTDFDPASVPMQKEASQEEAWKTEGKGWGEKEKVGLKVGVIALAVVLFVVGVAAGIYQFRKSSFAQERVTVSIEGPEEVRSGKPLEYVIAYQNNNRASLEKAVLKVTYPENFKLGENENFISQSPTAGYFKLNQITKYSEGKVNLKGKVYSPEGALIFLKAELVYVPSNFNSEFSSQGQLGVNIFSSPIELELQAPTNISSGDQVNYVLTYRNSGEEKFINVKIKAEYARSFTFSKAEPRAFDGNNIWFIGDLLPKQEGKIVISGKLTGEKDETQEVRFMVGSEENGEFVDYSDEMAETKVVTSPLLISQLVNGKDEIVVNPGDRLDFEINYKNDGATGLRDVIVTEKLEGRALDFSTLDLEGGAYDANEKKITWKASDYPALRSLDSGKSGKIKFSIYLKKNLPIDSEKDKEFVVNSLVQADSPDVPTPIHMNKIITGNSLDIKVNSKLGIDVEGFYEDSVIANTGPTPPIINQETTYTIHWILTNAGNDVRNAKVEATLPTGVTMTGKVFPQGVNLKHNERNNSIVWEVGDIQAGTGIIDHPLEAAFQIKIKPSITNLNKRVVILGESIFSTKDSFTGMDISAKGEKKDTYLPEDKTLDLKDKVQSES